MIVGDGELRDELEQQVKQLGLEKDVILTGSRQDVEALLSMMDLLVLPSLWEGLPTVIMEGMASGVPVVATDIPGTRELIEHRKTGWLAEVKNPPALAEAILDALKSESRRDEVVRRALSTVIPQYSMQSIAGRHQALYRQSLHPF
jgi:glycosyltransferase involved in cell wall biosynthesis